MPAASKVGRRGPSSRPSAQAFPRWSRVSSRPSLLAIQSALPVTWRRPFSRSSMNVPLTSSSTLRASPKPISKSGISKWLPRSELPSTAPTCKSRSRMPGCSSSRSSGSKWRRRGAPDAELVVTKISASGTKWPRNAARRAFTSLAGRLRAVAVRGAAGARFEVVERGRLQLGGGGSAFDVHVFSGNVQLFGVHHFVRVGRVFEAEHVVEERVGIGKGFGQGRDARIAQRVHPRADRGQKRLLDASAVDRGRADHGHGAVELQSLAQLVWRERAFHVLLVGLHD